VLVARRAAGKDWQRVASGGDLSSTDTLVSLPGYGSEVVTPGGVGLLLRGHVREFAQNALMSYLMESAVVLHKSATFDLDLTLLRGRIYLRNRKWKGPVKVRLRFEGQVWDLTLSDWGTEVGVDLIKAYTPDSDPKKGEEPRAELYLCVLSGEAELQVDAFHTHSLEAPPGPAVVTWNNFAARARGPVRLPQVPPVWDKDPPRTDVAKRMNAALTGLAGRLAGKKPVAVALREERERDSGPSRLLALYCAAALDDVGTLIEGLGDEGPTHAADREAAIFALRRWLSRGPGQVGALYDGRTKAGALIDRKYRAGEAQTILDLLFDVAVEERRDPDTFKALARNLESRRVAIAELAYWHLLRLSQPVKLPAFDAAASVEDRKTVADQVRKMIDAKKLPPPAPKEP
jgi:hypothetical protein